MLLNPNTTIYKYEIKPGNFDITVPKDSKVLSTIVQDGRIVVYILIPLDVNETTHVFFTVLGTGWEISWGLSDNLTFLGTVQMVDLVWHVFYEVE
jgi:hypothetical protein